MSLIQILEDLSLAQALDIFGLLTKTYPRYIDAPSREAVEDVILALVRSDQHREAEDGKLPPAKLGVADKIVEWVSTEAQRIASSGARYVSSRCCCGC